jgi:hypothetical protein
VLGLLNAEATNIGRNPQRFGRLGQIAALLDLVGDLVSLADECQGGSIIISKRHQITPEVRAASIHLFARDSLGIWCKDGGLRAPRTGELFRLDTGRPSFERIGELSPQKREPQRPKGNLS